MWYLSLHCLLSLREGGTEKGREGERERKRERESYPILGFQGVTRSVCHVCRYAFVIIKRLTDGRREGKGMGEAGEGVGE